VNYSDEKYAGLLLVIAVVLYVCAIFIAESVYPTYSVGQQYVSDLGDWNLAGINAIIFNASSVLYGVLGIAAVYFFHRAFKTRLFPTLLLVSSIGTIALGIVAENISNPIHTAFGFFSMLFGAFAAIASYKFVKSPLSFVFIIMGAVSILSLAAFVVGLGISPTSLGLGLGGIERFVIYPLLLWALSFGAYLIGEHAGANIT
jgi:hypothetical membrane protein